MREAEQSYIALIDLSCNEEFLELVKSSLLAAIESLPANAHLGLITFSTKACPAIVLILYVGVAHCFAALLARRIKPSTFAY